MEADNLQTDKRTVRQVGASAMEKDATGVRRGECNSVAGEAVLRTRVCTGFGQASACPLPGAPFHACVGVPERERVLWR